jgi:hypothetical protein
LCDFFLAIMNLIYAALLSACAGIQKNGFEVPTIPPLSKVEQPPQDLTHLYKQALHEVASKHREAWIAARGALPDV